MDCEAPEFAGHALATDTARTCLSIGDVRIALDADRKQNLAFGLQPFLTTESAIDVQVGLRWTDQIRPSNGSRTFDSGAVWKLSRENDEFVFDFASPALGSSPYKQLRTSDFAFARISLDRTILPCNAWPLEYPADELLVTNYLARNGLGVEVHGCGLLDPETGGHLFLGHSGAGKSTTTRLWQSLRKPEILSDDRIILRLHRGELWMYGTPWHGEAAFASAAKAKLNRILIVQHGVRNRIVALPKARAVGELFARCFPPFHSATGLQNTVEFLEHIAGTVPCYEFQFVPNASAVETVIGFHD